MRLQWNSLLLFTTFKFLFYAAQKQSIIIIIMSILFPRTNLRENIQKESIIHHMMKYKRGKSYNACNAYEDEEMKICKKS
jgi:hypothetical protein